MDRAEEEILRGARNYWQNQAEELRSKCTDLQAKVAALEGENKELAAQRDAFSKEAILGDTIKLTRELVEAREHVASLEATVRELRADSERLEWVLEHFIELNYNGKTQLFEVKFWRSGRVASAAKTWREAIDIARTAPASGETPAAGSAGKGQNE
jgi:predicted RNase H-like nuclease (RuvC/YqgF family)